MGGSVLRTMRATACIAPTRRGGLNRLNGSPKPCYRAKKRLNIRTPARLNSSLALDAQKPRAVVQIHEG